MDVDQSQQFLLHQRQCAAANNLKQREFNAEGDIATSQRNSRHNFVPAAKTNQGGSNELASNMAGEAKNGCMIGQSPTTGTRTSSYVAISSEDVQQRGHFFRGLSSKKFGEGVMSRHPQESQAFQQPQQRLRLRELPAALPGTMQPLPMLEPHD